MQSRRLFLKLSLQLSALATVAPHILSAHSSRKPFFKISLSEYSFQKSLKKGLFTHLEFPEKASKLFDLKAVDFGSVFFNGKENDSDYIKTLLQKCGDVSVKPQTIIIEEGALSIASNTERNKSIDNFKRWVDVAKSLECHSISVNDAPKGNTGMSEKLMIQSLTTLCDYAQPLGLNILVRNSNTNPKPLADVILGMKKINLGSMPEFGRIKSNSGDKIDPYRNLEILANFGKVFIAKSYDFDAAGEETSIDYSKMITLVNAALYKEYISVQYEGKKLTEEQGIKATLDLLQKSADKIKSPY